MKIYVNNLLLADEVKIADNFILRLKGFLGKKSINKGEGILLMNCPSIHCFFMKFPIDTVYISSNMTVLYKETIHPWKLGKIIKNTAHILELSKDCADSIMVGDKITVVQ